METIQNSFQSKKFNKKTEDFLCARLDADTKAVLINNLSWLWNKTYYYYYYYIALILYTFLIAAHCSMASARLEHERLSRVDEEWKSNFFFFTLAFSRGLGPLR